MSLPVELLVGPPTEPSMELHVGLLVGLPIELPVGLLVGLPVGLLVGLPVGLLVGLPVGLLVGLPVGLHVVLLLPTEPAVEHSADLANQYKNFLVLLYQRPHKAVLEY